MGVADDRSVEAPGAPRSPELEEAEAGAHPLVKGSVPRGCAVLVVGAGAVVALIVAVLRAVAASPAAPTPPAAPTAAVPSAVPTPIPAMRPSDLAPTDQGFVDPQGGLGWGNRCWAHIRAGRYDWARAACDRGLALNPGRPYPRANLLYNMGLIETHDGRGDLARRDLQESLALRPPSDIAGAAEVRKALAALGSAR